MASSPSALPWLWIIDALARFKQVDASVLKELIKRTPEISGDLGKDAREMVSFRVLDTLASEQVRNNGNASPAPVSENKFDPSERCENVLGRMLNENTDAAEMLKSEVQNFVTRKRTSLPKCTLQKLKDVILEGKNPAFAFLKEKSGLSTINKSVEGIAICDNIPNEATDLIDSQAVAGGNLISPNAENLNGLSREISRNKNLTPSKRDTSHLEREDPIFDHESDINSPITKKLKHDDSLICEQPEEVDKLDLSLPDYETTHYFPEIGISNAVPQRTPFNYDKNHTLGRECSSDSDGYQDERIDIATKKCIFLKFNLFTQDSLATAGSTEVNICMKCEKGGELLVCSATDCPIVVHQSCLGNAPTFDKIGKFFCPFCSYSRAIRKYRKKKKNEFLIRKDLTVFLGSDNRQRPKQIENKSNGPKHNQEKQDEDVYRNGKKHPKNRVNDALNTENMENVENAPTSTGNRPLSVEIANKSSELEHNQQRGNGIVYRNDQKRQNHVNDVIDTENKENIRDTRQTEPSTNNGNSFLRKKDAFLDEGKDFASMESNIEGGKLDPECQQATVLEREEVEEDDSQDGCNKNSPCEEREFVPMTEKDEAEQDKHGPDADVAACSEEEDHGPFSKYIMKPRSRPKRQLKRGSVPVTKKHAPEQDKHGSNADVAALGEEEDYGPFADYIMRPRNPKSAYPATPQMRRVKMEWTSVEEKVLNEGVKNFKGDHDKTIQWKTILEFGSPVFHKGRTAVDLKDKWRNICKRRTNP